MHYPARSALRRMAGMFPSGSPDSPAPDTRPLQPSERTTSAVRRPLSRIAALAVGASLFAAAPAAASSTQIAIFDGGEAFTNPFKQAAALDDVRSLGGRWARIIVQWRYVAPAPDSATKPAGFNGADPNAPGYNWSGVDQAINAARSRGMRLLLTPSGNVPKWASGTRADYTTEPNATEWGAFIQAIGRRYRSQVGKWALFNEANQNAFLKPQYKNGRPYSPTIYRRLWDSGIRGFRSAGISATNVIFGETAPRGGSAVAPLAFLRGALCLNSSYRRARRCSKVTTAGFGHHAYSTRSGPFSVPSNRDDVTIGSLSRLTAALDRAARANMVSRSLGVWLTEYGVQSKPDPFLGATEQEQAEFLAMSERIAYRNSRVRSYAQYLLYDDEPRKQGSRYSGFESGLRHSYTAQGGRPKLAYYGWRLPLVVETPRRGSRATVWGLIRPAGRVTTARLEYRDGSRGTWRLMRFVRTNRSGYISSTATLRTGRVFRLKWGSAEGPPIRAKRWPR